MTATDSVEVSLEAFGSLEPVSRAGGQGRVHRPEWSPPGLSANPIVVKLYRRPPASDAAGVLTEMVRWERALVPADRAQLRRLAAWPVAVVRAGGRAVGIAMNDVRPRFAVPFVMPSGRSDPVLLALEHLLGSDSFLQNRGLGIRLDTALRALVAHRICGAIGCLHRHGIAVGDVAPSNVLVSVASGGPHICLIDCDSMVFRGRQALAAVETGDWNLPPEFGERPGTRAADAYKLGLVVLRLFARSHDARSVGPHLRHLPVEIRDLLHRALSSDAANRPPAGEWQRKLHGLVSQGGVNILHPGPVATPTPGLRSTPTAAILPSGSRAGPAPLRGGAPVPAAHIRRRQPATAGRARVAPASRPPNSPVGRAGRRRSGGSPTGRSVIPRAGLLGGSPGAAPGVSPFLRRAVALLWVIALAVVVAVLLSRLAAPPQGPQVTTTLYPQGPGGRIFPNTVRLGHNQYESP